MTIGEIIGNIEVAPQYSQKEANDLIDEYRERIRLEGELIEHEIRHFGEEVVTREILQSLAEPWMFNLPSGRGDLYKQMELDTLRDKVDWYAMDVA
tara:strand:- start:26838 stop:27125 length:288 start_codon:yes stop_codon:yes gene_type:complete